MAGLFVFGDIVCYRDDKKYIFSGKCFTCLVYLMGKINLFLMNSVLFFIF